MREWILQKDDVYKWELISENEVQNSKVFLIRLTSLKWKSPKEVQNPIWTHLLKIVVPKKILASASFFFISGRGAYGYERSHEVSPFILNWAEKSASIVCELSLQPSRLVQFKDEAFEKIEDEQVLEDQYIAYSWDQYLKSGDKSWPLQMPMTKAVVRAFDCIEEFSQKHLSSLACEFVVAGLSKRGWITWLSAVVDKRVIGIIPMVIDLLNLKESFSHQLNVYGKWARVVKDYEKIDLIKWAHTKEFSDLLNLIEPYEYRKKIKIPKYIINASGDEFFLPDSSQFYFKELEDPKFLRYVPNCPHNLFESEDALSSAFAFYQMLIHKKDFPKFSWSQKGLHQIELKCQDSPNQIYLFYANNEERRDFRYYEVGPIWKKTSIKLSKNGEYLIELTPPKKGFRAFFIELQYPGFQKKPLILSTDVYVLTKERES